MNNRPVQHRARNHQVQNKRKGEQQSFTPTLRVERPIVWDDTEKKKTYNDKIHRAYGLYLTKAQKNRLQPVRPDDQRIVTINEVALADQNRQLHRSDKRAGAIEKLAGLLQERLSLLLEGSDETLKMPLGKLACQKLEVANGNRDNSSWSQQYVGAHPVGWRGTGCKYAKENSEGDRSVAWQLAQDEIAFKESITEVNRIFDPDVLTMNPLLPLIAKRPKNKPPINDDFSIIRDCLERGGSLLEEIAVGDPLIIISTGPHSKDQIVLPVRNIDPVYVP